MEARIMHDFDQINLKLIKAAGKKRLETVYCPRDGRRVLVTFEISDGLLPVRTGVAMCARNIYDDRFDPPLGEGACTQPCLSPEGGKAFC
jgi:hypothetical protein